jgi:hypothetical protein
VPFTEWSRRGASNVGACRHKRQHKREANKKKKEKEKEKEKEEKRTKGEKKTPPPLEGGGLGGGVDQYEPPTDPFPQPPPSRAGESPMNTTLLRRKNKWILR